MNKVLHIDIETYCDLDLPEVGVYKYAEHDSFRVLLFAYAYEDEEVRIVDLTKEELPERLKRDITSSSVTKVAHNANFERTCLRKLLNAPTPLDPAQWECTMVGAAYLGLPLKLDAVASVLGLSEQKDSKGKALISYFSKPCRATKANGGRTRNLPEHDPEKWEMFKEYCVQDVRTERAIDEYLNRQPAHVFEATKGVEKFYWRLDQNINDRGIYIDTDFARAAIESSNACNEETHDEMVRLTGIDNPNSVSQLKSWIKEQTGRVVESLGKEFLQDAINDDTLPSNVRRVLELRLLASRTSIKKYDAMLNFAQKDNRVRGTIQFYGANRTGRFSGRGIQVQNLKRTISKNLLTAREAVCKGVGSLLYDDLPDVISRLTRTAIMAKEGHTLVVSDFSAIEARVLAWLAGEKWVLDVFTSHGKIYEATAANMFNVPLEMVTKGSDLRAKGKVATLALGYQGGVGALIAMGALREGLTEEELPSLVSSWRAANRKIVRFWAEVEEAAKKAISQKTSVTLRKPFCELNFIYYNGYLHIKLPSGRFLSYFGASVEKGRITFYGLNQVSKKWEKTQTYGGSLVENITQAVARDCLCGAMLRMHKEGFSIIMHIHDEIVSEEREEVAEAALKRMNEIMSVPPSWARGLPLKGDGYISKFYKKD